MVGGACSGRECRLHEVRRRAPAPAGREDALAARIEPEHREPILRIRTAVWRHPGYRKSFGSMDVYRAVLDRGIRTPEQFIGQLETR
jgi:hypothetical protein